MQPRRKPIPSPIARPSDLGQAPRALVPARVRSMLPTVAALLAMAAVGCDRETSSITRDEPTFTVAQSLAREKGAPEKGALEEGAHAKPPRSHDPTEPLPSLGIIEEAPPPPPPVPVAPTPTTHPYPVKGGMKAVHPVPTPPPMPGGIGMVKPKPITPTTKPVKLGGDVAAVFPETT